MTVAFDATSTKVETTGDSTWSHTAAASVKAVLIYIVIRNSNTPPIGVTYAGVAMKKIAEANDTATEPGNTTAWLLAKPWTPASGTQTISVDVGALQVWGGVAISVTATDEIDYYYGLVQENAADPSPTVNQPSAVPAGFVGYPSAAMFSGLAAPTSITAGTNYTTFGAVDFSGGGVSDCAQFERRTSGTVTGTPTVNMSTGGTSDDCAYIAVTLGEQPAAVPLPILVTPVGPSGV